MSKMTSDVCESKTRRHMCVRVYMREGRMCTSEIKSGAHE